MPIRYKLLTGKKLTDHDGRTKQATEVATDFASFVAGATRTLDIAIYHFRLGGTEAQIVLDALKKAAGTVQVRLAYFHEKPRSGDTNTMAESGGTPGTPFDESQFEGSNVQLKPIDGIDLNHLPHGVDPKPIEGGGHLMHSKYMIRDGSDIWMGSANFTSEAWSVQDNNIVIFEGAADLAGFYATDFQELWDTGRIAGTGKNDEGSVTVGGTSIDIDFSPGDGARIDQTVSGMISAATHTVDIASMVISSGAVLSALVEAIERGITVTGVYDGPQMSGIEKDWARASTGVHGAVSNGKAEQWGILKDHLVGKKSMPFNPNNPGAAYNFMHNKAVVVDGRTVLTGSFNFSQNATRNAENVVTIQDEAIAKAYADYIDNLVKIYS